MALPRPRDCALGACIGSGSYGRVYRARRASGLRAAVAVKCVARREMRGAAEVDNLVTEIALLKALRHEHIVELVDFSWDSNFIYIVTEYCENGDLSHYIRVHKRLREQVVQTFLRQLASALAYLRSKSVAHMDLKPQNILLSGGTRPKLKLADFGLAQFLDPGQKKRAMRGSLLYMAPEMALGRKYDAKVDLWSIGVILYECCFGNPPFRSETTEQLMAKIRDPKEISIPSEPPLSAACVDLLRRCLRRDPCERIDFDDFFTHVFVDLDHAPCQVSLEKAQKLELQARELDKKSEHERALHLYQESLDHFIPCFKNEENLAQKEELKGKCEQIIRRAETIKARLNKANPKSVACSKEAKIRSAKVKDLNVSRNSSNPSTSANNATSIATNTTDSSVSTDKETLESDREELLRLATTTSKLLTGLEIAVAAEMYESEGSFTVALEKYELALGLLIPLLRQEPKGRRQVLLHAEVNQWMSKAERVKHLLQVQEQVIKDNLLCGTPVNKDKCGVQ